VKVQDFADLVLDTGAPPGDAMVTVPGLDTPVAPGSTVGGCLLVNGIKAEVAARLAAAGHPPRVLTGSVLVGPERSKELFEAAYDEHARRLAKLYAHLGESPLRPQYWGDPRGVAGFWSCRRVVSDAQYPHYWGRRGPLYA
jgi:hypothetical protein